MNKTLLKLAGLIFLFSIIDGLVILYWLMRCYQTQSAFYCDAFAFAGILIILGIPALVLIGSSLILLAFSKWYKGNVSIVAKSIIIILGVILFVAPYTPLLLPSDQPKTYQGFQNLIEQGRVEQEREKERQCAEYRQKMSEYREGQPMPVPPRGCN
ncbi:MAG TPA: hypothetical protein VJB92_01230 [Candidatus Paceibacterota bacterium]